MTLDTVGALIEELRKFPEDTPLGRRTCGQGGGIVPVVLVAEGARSPHPGWPQESGLSAVGFELGSPAALYHEKRGGVFLPLVVVLESYL